jgi:hypothetical protein
MAKAKSKLMNNSTPTEACVTRDKPGGLVEADTLNFPKWRYSECVCGELVDADFFGDYRTVHSCPDNSI